MLAGMLLSQEHTRPLAKELFCPTLNQAILVLDGTYVYKRVHSFPFKGGNTVCRSKGEVFRITFLESTLINHFFKLKNYEN